MGTLCMRWSVQRAGRLLSYTTYLITTLIEFVYSNQSSFVSQKDYDHATLVIRVNVSIDFAKI